jgi:hypothetical protein
MANALQTQVPTNISLNLDSVMAPPNDDRDSLKFAQIINPETRSRTIVLAASGGTALDISKRISITASPPVRPVPPPVVRARSALSALQTVCITLVAVVGLVVLAVVIR